MFEDLLRTVPVLRFRKLRVKNSFFFQKFQKKDANLISISFSIESSINSSGNLIEPGLIVLISISVQVSRVPIMLKKFVFFNQLKINNQKKRENKLVQFWIRLLGLQQVLGVLQDQVPKHVPHFYNWHVQLTICFF